MYIKNIMLFIIGFSITISYSIGILIYKLIEKLKPYKEYEPILFDEWMPDFTLRGDKNKWI